MLSKQDVVKLYETVLSIPGMNEVVKLDLKMPRKSVLILSKVIQRGLGAENEKDVDPGVLEVLPEETRQELLKLSADMLQKSGLQEMDEKLASFRAS